MMESAQQDSQPPAMAQRPKVIYVMGAGRSGSTILGVTLGNCAGVFYAGELDKWLLRSGEPKLEGAGRIEFWQSVRAGVTDPEPLFGGEAHRYLERSSALFRRRRRAVRSRIRERYRRVMTELYGAIVVNADATHLVDTSHYPLRAHELQAIDGIDLYIVLLLRDTARVIESFAREDVAEPRFGASKTRAYLLLTYVLSTWVFLKQPAERRLVVRHEDFLGDPEGVVRAILDHVGSSVALPDFSALRTGIPLQGNRLIQKDVVSLERSSKGTRPDSGGSSWLDLPMLSALSRLRPRAADRPGAGGGPAVSS
jgi:hypothetical protein